MQPPLACILVQVAGILLGVYRAFALSGKIQITSEEVIYKANKKATPIVKVAFLKH